MSVRLYGNTIHSQRDSLEKGIFLAIFEPFGTLKLFSAFSRWLQAYNFLALLLALFEVRSSTFKENDYWILKYIFVQRLCSAGIYSFSERHLRER